MTKRDNHIFRTKILTPLRELDTFNSSAAPSLQILCGFRDQVIKSNLVMRAAGWRFSFGEGEENKSG